MAEYVAQTIAEQVTLPAVRLYAEGQDVLESLRQKLDEKVGFWRAMGWVAGPPQVSVTESPLLMESTVSVKVVLTRRTDG